MHRSDPINFGPARQIAAKPEGCPAMSSKLSLEDLPDALLAEIVKRIANTSDLKSISLVSKRLYTIEAEQRSSICVGSDLCPAIDALSALCSRIPQFVGSRDGLLWLEISLESARKTYFLIALPCPA